MKLLAIAGAVILFCLGLAPAQDTEKRVEALLAQMTLAEKIDLLGGINAFQVRGAPRLGVPVMTMADSPFGVRNNVRSTVYAGGINLAASWNPSLAAQVGTQIGRDARARGVHFNLGPGVNIYRSPLNGRNFEYYGEDPFLAGRIAVGYIRGAQSQGVSATIKHFLANNSEFARHTSDAVIDERTLREIYLPAFEMAVKEGEVGAIMDSYNLINGIHATANAKFNTELLRGEWKFPGVVMSDWDSTYETLGVANGGMDLEMPGGKFLNQRTLAPLLQSGQVTVATIDEKVRRILRLAVRMGWLDRPQQDVSIPLYNPEGRAAALQAAREGMVLLKNDQGILPFDKNKIKTVALIGPNAYPTSILGGGSAAIFPYRAVSYLEGMSNQLGQGGRALHAGGLPYLLKVARNTRFTTSAEGGQPGLKTEIFDNPNLSGAPASVQTQPFIALGEPIDLSPFGTGETELDFSLFFNAKPYSRRWTGYYKAEKSGKYDIFAHLGGFQTTGFRLYVDDQLLADRWAETKAVLESFPLDLAAGPHKIVLEFHGVSGLFASMMRLGIVPQGAWVEPDALAKAAQADAVVLAVGFDNSTETENFDRTFALPPGQEELIKKVAAVNKNTVVVITSGGGVDMENWLADAAGVVQAWYAGQEGGTALGEILFGAVNPSGHLPATFERRAQDNPTFNNYYKTPGTNKIEYREGVFVGYRGYEKNNVKPLFPFGFGLSYTTFKYSGLAVKKVGGDKYEVSFAVANTGRRAGAAVPQIYVAQANPSVSRPPKELRGFAKINLRPGQTQTVTVPLDYRSFAYYDVAGKQWKADAGAYQIMLGSSSADIELKTQLMLGN